MGAVPIKNLKPSASCILHFPAAQKAGSGLGSVFVIAAVAERAFGIATVEKKKTAPKRPQKRPKTLQDAPLMYFESELSLYAPHPGTADGTRSRPYQGVDPGGQPQGIAVASVVSFAVVRIDLSSTLCVIDAG